jgi:hypothetical protein
MFCGDCTALVEPVCTKPEIETAPLAVGEAVTFWNWPPVMMAGETTTFTLPAPVCVTAAVTTKRRSWL